MSTKVKKCKTCGTSEVSDFAPRKSVICKNCDKGNIVPISIPELTPVEAVSQEIIENPINEVQEIAINDEKGLKNIIENLEETVKQLQEDIKKLNKLKKLFPRIFPEDTI